MPNDLDTKEPGRSPFLEYLQERRKLRQQLPQELADFGRKIDIAYNIARMTLWGAQPPGRQRYYISAWRVNRRRQPTIMRLIKTKPKWRARRLERLSIRIPKNPLWSEQRRQAIQGALQCFRLAQTADMTFYQLVKFYHELRHSWETVLHQVEVAADAALKSRHLLYEDLRSSGLGSAPLVTEGMLADWWNIEPEEIPIRLDDPCSPHQTSPAR